MKRFFWLLGFILAVGTAAAQNDISAQMMAVPTVTHIGEAVELVVTVEHPVGYRVIAPQLGQTWGHFEVRSQTAPIVAAVGDGRESSHFSIVVIAWQLGEFTSPTLAMMVSNMQGELVEVTAAPVTIRVESVLTENDLALRDIKPQATLPLSIWWPWLVGLGVLLLSGVLLWWRREGEPALPFVDNRLPYQIALDELDEIAAAGLAERGDFKAYYTQTTDVLRRYLDGALGLKTEEQTTREIRQAIQPLLWGSEAKKLLVKLLNEADLVKFARVRPTVEDARQATGEAKKLVLMAKEHSLANNREQSKDD